MTIYKRIGSFLLSLLLVFSMFGSTFAIQTFAATSPALSAESKTVNAGEQFTVAVSLANATTVYGGNFTLQYDSSLLTADSYEFGYIVSGHTKNCNLNYQSAGNLIRVTFSGASAVTTSGTLITFTFTAKENVSGSAALQFNAYKMYDENGSAITSTASGSTITIATEPVVSPTLSITNKTVTEGSTVNVPIVISDSEAVYGGNFTLQYDSDLLTANSYTFGSIVSGHTKNCNLDYQSAGNLIRVTFSGAEAISADGTIITLTFTAKTSGTASLKFNAYKMYDENGTSIDTTVSNGNVTINTKPDIDTTKPTGSISTTNNLAIYQTLTLTMTDNIGVKSYYFGTSSSPSSSSFTSITSSTYATAERTVSSPGTYYLIVKDAAGNTSTISETFYKTTLNANGGSLPVNYIITKSGNSITVPAPNNSDSSMTFVGWGTSASATTGVKTFTVTSSKTYYAIWTKTTPDIITGKCGDDAYFEIDVNSGLLTVSGSGLTYDWSEPYDSQAPSDAISLYTYKDYILTAVIENGITSIGNDMFKGCNSLTSVKIANSVKSIGWEAFANCTKLSNVEFVEGSVTTEITFRTFAYCSSLTNIELSKNVKITGARPFEGCYNLTDIIVSSNNPYHSSVDGVLFNKNKTELLCFPSGAGTSYIIPSGVDVIGSYAFSFNKILKNVVLPTNIEEIEQDAFAYCWVLESITVPSTVTEIGAYAFDFCSELKTATIYGKDVTFGYKVFEGCDKLTVYGYKGSTTQTYAIENAITFIPLESDISSIAVSAAPGETLYIGDTLDVDHIQIRVYFSDGTTDILTEGFTVTGFDSSSAGTKTVTISYEGFTTTYDFTVYTPSITLSQSTLSLNKGDTVTLTARTAPSGNTVTWTSSDTSVATVSGGMITAKASGSTTITAKFTYNGKTYSKTCSVTVDKEPEPVPTSLSVSSKPTKTTYEIGESLNTSGLKLKLTYSDGSTETITSGFTTSGFSSTTSGTKTVTVEYGGLTTTFTVTVTSNPPPTPTSLTVSTKPTKTTYEIGESLNTSGLELKLTYSDGSTETITSGFTTSGFSSSTIGTKTVTVKYSGLTTTFIVTVIDNPVLSYDAYVHTEAKKVVVQGSQFTYTVSLAGTYDGFSFEITSGNGLSVTDIITTNPNINIDKIGDKWMVSVLGGLAKTDAEKEELVTVTVQVASDAELGARTIALSNLMLSSETGDKVSAIKYEYASIEITDQIPGDINGDGIFDYYDVSKLYAYYRNKTTLSESVDTDVNGDGGFDYYDVSKLYAIYRGKANFN